MQSDKGMQADPGGDSIENTPTNKSNNRPFEDVIKTSSSRRSFVAGGLTAAAATFLAPATHAGWGKWHPKHGKKRRSLVNFAPVKISDVTDTRMPTISDDYYYQAIIPWGTPLEPGSTAAYEGDPNTRPTADEQAKQIGIGHDGMWYFPMDRMHQPKSKHQQRRYRHHMTNMGMLCINHEYGGNDHVLGKSAPESLEDVRLSQNAHGVSVVALQENWHGQWMVVSSPNSRRITGNTPVGFSGPAANSPLLKNENGNVPLGTLNNCGSGPTPWGTYLTCEENFNGYFGSSEPFTPTEEQDRYGLSENGFGYQWHNYDKRFDMSNSGYLNESNRFGYIVEIDPFDASQKPMKRTALGRFKHEAIAIAESYTGQIAAYMGDDQRFDYCYKYVSNKAWKQAIADKESPLDDGKLYVAKFNDNGTGEWMELTIDNPVLAARFSSQAEVLIYARLAADILGATPMDRPEWTTIGKKGEVFWTLTNNTNRTPDNVNGPNPIGPNPDGQIIRTKDFNDHLGTHFKWDIYLLAQDTRGTEEVFTDPDAAYADEDGRLFIGTDGGQPDGLQDQLVVFDTRKKGTPDPQRLLVGVTDDEVTGFTMTPDRRTAFVNLQHPGNGDPSKTNFPAQPDGYTIPRDCTLVIRRKDGGIIGS